MTPGKVHTLTQLFLVFDLWMKLTDTRCILKLDDPWMVVEEVRRICSLLEKVVCVLWKRQSTYISHLRALQILWMHSESDESFQIHLLLRTIRIRLVGIHQNFLNPLHTIFPVMHLPYEQGHGVYREKNVQSAPCLFPRIVQIIKILTYLWKQGHSVFIKNFV